MKIKKLEAELKLRPTQEEVDLLRLEIKRLLEELEN